MALLIYPHNAGSVWASAWAHELAGRHDEGRRLVQAYTAMGLR